MGGDRILSPLLFLWAAAETSLPRTAVGSSRSFYFAILGSETRQMKGGERPLCRSAVTGQKMHNKGTDCPSRMAFIYTLQTWKDNEFMSPSPPRILFFSPDFFFPIMHPYLELED